MRGEKPDAAAWRCLLCRAEGTTGEAGWKLHWVTTHLNHDTEPECH